MSSGVDQPDRIVGSSFVEIGSVDVTVIGELAFVPAIADEPFAWLELGKALVDAAEDFLDVGGIAQADVVEFVGAAVGEVAVSVDQTGSGCAAVEVDDAGGGRGERLDLRVGADSGDLAGGDGDGFGDGVVRVDNENFAVVKNEIGSGLRRSGDAVCGMCGE